MWELLNFNGRRCSKKLIPKKKMKWKYIFDARWLAIKQRGYWRWCNWYLSKFKDEFEIPVCHHLATQAVPGSILQCDLKHKLTSDCSGISTLSHLIWWTRLEMYNVVWELSYHMTIAHELHYKALFTTANYCVRTNDLRLFTKFIRNRDRKNKIFEFFQRIQRIREVLQGQKFF